MARALEGFRESEAGAALSLAGGEDYELLVAAPAGALGPLAAPFEAAFGIPLTRIGQVGPGAGLRWVGAGAEGPRLDLSGFDHFRAGPPPDRPPANGPSS